MNDRHIAGEQVGKLGQEQGRAQIVGEALVQERLRIGRSAEAGQDLAVDDEIALAAARRDDHVHMRQAVEIAGKARIGERQAGGIGAEALPRLHLANVGLARDLLVELERHHRQHRERREMLRIGGGRPGLVDGQRLPMRIQPLAERGNQADAGDPDVAGVAHAVSPTGTRPICRTRSRMFSMSSGAGKSITRSVSSASQTGPFDSIFASVTPKPEPSCVSVA